MARRNLTLQWPAAGLHKRAGYQSQPPFTTPDCLNVRLIETLEGRERGGSRPGLGKAFYEQLGAGNPIRFLDAVTFVKADQIKFWEDSFRGNALGAAWSAASWINASLPDIFPGDYADVSFNVSRGAVRSALGFDTTAVYQIDLFVVPYLGAHHGTYSIFLKMNDTTPLATTDGIAVELTLTGSSGLYSGNLKGYNAGVVTTTALSTASTGQAEAGYFSVLYTPSSGNVKVYWLGTLLTSTTVTLGAGAGNRFGFGLNCTVSGGVCLADSFRIQYRSTGNVQTEGRFLVASSNGILYREGLTSLGKMDQVTTTALTVASDRVLQTAERSQKLYIADTSEPAKFSIAGAGATNGTSFDDAAVADWTAVGINAVDWLIEITAGTGSTTNGVYAITSIASGAITLATSAGIGSCNYRIVRGPKVYDPFATTLTLLAATAGILPMGCSLIALYRDRLVLAGDPNAPHVWFMARSGTPTDFDYAASADDGGRAVAGTSSDAGQIGEAIKALIPFSDDYLIFGCTNSLWILRGDPATNGEIQNLSRTIGVVGPKAWCNGPNGEVIFLSRDGLYALAPGGGGFPQSLSRERLPRDLLDIDTLYNVSMVYDVKDRGIHIFTTAPEARGQLHFWYDWTTRSFWPVRLQNTHEPLCAFYYSATDAGVSAALLGCRDGYIRRFRDVFEQDGDSTITNHVMLGPFRLGDDTHDGLLAELLGALDKSSGSVTWSVLVGKSHEDALDASAFATGTWAADLNFKARPRARGMSAIVKIAGSGARAWALERATVVVEKLGMQRLP